MNEKLRGLVREIFKLNAELRSLLGVNTEQALGRPATETEIRALETHLEVTLPPSYRDFLRICNGWQHFSGNLHLLSVAQQIEGEYAQYVHQWKGEQWAAGEPVPVESLVVGIALHTNTARLLDRNKVGVDGEMEAVWWEDEELHRYQNLTEMLEQHKKHIRLIIQRKRRQKK